MSGGKPASSPTPPVTVDSATRGPASRLVSGAISGTAPKCTSSSGATAACADAVAPKIVAIQRGRTAGTSPPPASTPAVAATDSWKPTSPTSSAETSSSPVTAPPSAAQGPSGNPAARPPSTIAAMTAARSTEGSQRVTTTKSASPARPATARRRGPIASGPTTIHHSSRNRATLLPETATKWAKPARRSAPASAAGSRRTSPMRKPERRAAAGPPSSGRPAARRDRSRLPAPNNTPSASSTRTT